MIDVHCHIEDEVFDKNREKIIENAKNAGVKAIITSGLGYNSAIKALSISDGKYIFLSIGLPPYDLSDFNKVIYFIEKNIDKIIAIGEVGLDYYLGRENTREEQLKCFKFFIKLAKDYDLPLIVHSRSAGKYAIETLINEKAEKVVLHAFDGKAKYALKGIEYGYYFSIPPSIVRSKQKQNLVKILPIDFLMLESDSPVLGPIANEINEPKNIIFSVNKIAEIKNLPIKKVIEITTNNAKKVFNINI
jgi:TatD DNase family protein